jgi:hypothetical protein
VQGISTARNEGASPKSRPGHIRGPGEETSLVGDRSLLWTYLEDVAVCICYDV